MTPTILFVPGLWEGSAPFADVISLLKSRGYSTHFAALPSTGTKSPGNPGMKDDIAAFRSTIVDIVDAGEDIVLMLHSVPLADVWVQRQRTGWTSRVDERLG